MLQVEIYIDMSKTFLTVKQAYAKLGLSGGGVIHLFENMNLLQLESVIQVN